MATHKLLKIQSTQFLMFYFCLLSVCVPVFADVFTCERGGQRSVWVFFLSGSLPESGAHRLNWAGQPSEFQLPRPHPPSTQVTVVHCSKHWGPELRFLCLCGEHLTN